MNIPMVESLNFNGMQKVAFANNLVAIFGIQRIILSERLGWIY
jgi:hypothetical protein